MKLDKSTRAKARSSYAHPLVTSYKCPKCLNSFAVNNSVAKHTRITSLFSFSNVDAHDGVSLQIGGKFQHPINPDEEIERSGIDVVLMQCPIAGCEEYILYINSYGNNFENFKGQFLPNEKLTTFPDYVPEHIKKDIQEAELILKLSPKASATLSRRSLQAMIRDFHGVEEKSLHKEIETLYEKALISKSDHDIFMGIKSIGNDGAHVNLDNVNMIIEIEEHEADDLINAILYFIDDWYGNRYRKEQVFKRMKSGRNRK